MREAIWGEYRWAMPSGVRLVLMMVERRSIRRVLMIWYRALWTKAVVISLPRSSRISRSQERTRST